MDATSSTGAWTHYSYGIRDAGDLTAPIVGSHVEHPCARGIPPSLGIRGNREGQICGFGSQLPAGAAGGSVGMRRPRPDRGVGESPSY
jgi:3-dehydroquinate dehydratase